MLFLNGCCNIMLTTKQSLLATKIEKGSAEHLFALIDLCRLIERHKKFILPHAKPREIDKSRSTEITALQGEIRDPGREPHYDDPVMPIA
jgi:hypothetical protein